VKKPRLVIVSKADLPEASEAVRKVPGAMMVSAATRAGLDRFLHATADLVDQITDDEMRNIREMVGGESFAAGLYEQSRQLFETVAIAPDFQEFLTLPAYELID